MNNNHKTGIGGTDAPQNDTKPSAEGNLLANLVDALATGQTLTDFACTHNIKVSALLQHILMMPGVASACQIALHQHADALETKAAKQLRDGLSGQLKTAEGRVLLQLSKVMERQVQSKRDQAQKLQEWLKEAQKHRPRGSWLTRARIAPWAMPLYGAGDDTDEK
jgi:hypothetical protein